MFRFILFALNLALGNVILLWAKEGDRSGMAGVHIVFSLVALLLFELAVRLVDKRPKRWVAVATPLVVSILVPMISITLWMTLDLALAGDFSVQNTLKAAIYGVLLPMAGFFLVVPMAIMNVALFAWRLKQVQLRAKG